MHIHCGDCSADILKSVLPDSEIIVWCDLLFDGPLRADVPAEQFIRRRAEFISETMGGAISVEKCMAKFNRQENDLEKYKVHEEIYFWFDACMYDQFIMLRLLDYFNSGDLKGKKLKLICIGEYHGIDRFLGLGQLNADQLLSLMDKAVILSDSDLKNAAVAWGIIRSEKAEDIINFSDYDAVKFPYFAEAFQRFCQQYPSKENGLNRFENEILKVISEGKNKPSEIFKSVSDIEARPFFGDTYMWYVIRKLSQLKAAPVIIEGPGFFPSWAVVDIDRWKIFITEAGKKVLSRSSYNV